MYRNGLGLQSLVSLEDWQKFQDSYSEILGLTLRTIDLDGRQVTKTSGPYFLCDKVLPKTPEYNKTCGISFFKKRAKERLDELTRFKCPFGLELYILPIKAIGNRIIAYMAVGPVVPVRRKNRSEYAKEAKTVGIHTDELLDGLIEINVFSYDKIRSIIKSLESVFSYVAQTGYHKKRLGEIGHDVIEVDPLFSSYYEEKILNAFLNTCTAAFTADSGSVMLLDKKTNRLHIKAASKINKNIVNRTNLKMGEGIAGVAAATAEPILLPKDSRKSGVSSKMKRAYIKSSMIIPFNKANTHDVYGVINLNILRKDKEFTNKDIRFAKELVNLVSIALMPLE